MQRIQLFLPYFKNRSYTARNSELKKKIEKYVT